GTEAGVHASHRCGYGRQRKADRQALAGNTLRRSGRRAREGCRMTLQRLAAKPDSISVSFEFFPRKTPAMEEQLWRAIRRLEPLAPSFVSVTYGAGGSTRDRTHATVKRIVEETRLVPAAHLTCVAATRKEVDEIVRLYWNS